MTENCDPVAGTTTRNPPARRDSRWQEAGASTLSTLPAGIVMVTVYVPAQATSPATVSSSGAPGS